MSRSACAAVVVAVCSLDCAPADDVEPPTAAPPAAPPAPATFDELLAAVDASPEDARQALVDAFLAERAAPLVDETGVVFIWRKRAGSADASVLVAGDFDNWTGSPTEPIAASDVRFRRVELASDARVDYKFIVDGEWLLDPLNARTCESGFGDNSEVAMPAWEYPSDIDFNGAIDHGSLNGALIVDDATLPPAILLTSSTLGNTRDVWLYLPPPSSAPAGAVLPLLVVNDGNEYLRIAHMHHVLDAVIARGEVEPLAVAFVAPVNRTAEYVGGDVAGYVATVRDDLLPLVHARVADAGYTLANDPARRGVWGTSNSGYVSARLTRDLPEVFARFASQSGVLLSDGGAVIEDLASPARAASLRVWLDTGTIFDTLEENRVARDAFVAGGVDHEYLEVNEGHSWGSWRARLAPGLRALFPATP